jgi:hypothetical protein
LAQNFPEHVVATPTEPAAVVVKPLPFMEPCGGPEQASKQLFESFEINDQEVVFDVINALWQAAKIGKKPRRFIKPTPEQIQEYCDERKNGIVGQDVWDFYESQGWKKSNGVAITDWKRCVNTWEKNRIGEREAPPETPKPTKYPEPEVRKPGMSKELKEALAKAPKIRLDD